MTTTVRQGFMLHDSDVTGVDKPEGFAFAEERFDFVELNMEYGFEVGRIDADRVADLATRRGVDLLVHLPYRLDAGSPQDHVREGSCRELEAALDVAAEVGAEKAVMHAGTMAHGDAWDRETVVAANVESIGRVREYGADRGVEVVVENLKGPFVDVHDFPNLLSRTDATMCLDTGHAHLSGMGLDEQADFIRDHGDRISHVHLNDTRRDDDDEHLPVGLGTLDFGPLADAMRETGWTGTCTHEVFGFDLEYVGLGKERFDRLLARSDSPPGHD